MTVPLPHRFCTAHNLYPCERCHKMVYRLEDLQQLRKDLVQLDKLIYGLWMDGFPVTREYLQEKFDAVLDGHPPPLHPVLARFYEYHQAPPP
jgi:hypothetical protein